MKARAVTAAAHDPASAGSTAPAGTTAGGADSGSPPRSELAILALLTLAALLIRLTSLSRSLFTDEAYSLALAQRGFGHMFSLFGYEANGTPYAIVLWPLVRIFGTGEQLLRLPAVVAGAASVPALWWAARNWVSGRAALLAAALLALNPMAVWYGQSARAYSFVVLFSCLAFGALPRALAGRGGTRGWWPYVAAMALLAYCDIFAAPLALPAQALIVARARRGGGSTGAGADSASGVGRHPAPGTAPSAPWAAWARALAATALACIPLLVAAVIARGRRDALYWLPKTDRSLIELAVQEFTAGFSEVKAIRWLTVLVLLVLVAGALWLLRRRREPLLTSPLAIAISWAVLPAAILLLVSFVKPVFWPRYAILGVPGLCLLAVIAGELLWRERRLALPALASAGALLVLAGVADVKQRRYLQEDWPPAAAWLSAERRPGQPVILDNDLTLPSLGYYDRQFRAGKDLVVREWHDRPVPAGLAGYKDQGGYGGVPDGPPSAADARRLAATGGGTLWFVIAEADAELQDGNPREGAAVNWARSHCQVEVRESVGVWVMRAAGCR